jgi:small-conductance mechanosensitive channel
MNNLPDVIQRNLGNFAWRFGALLFVFVLRWALVRTLSPRLETDEARFRLRKNSLYTAWAIVLLVLLVLLAIWFTQLENVG